MIGERLRQIRKSRRVTQKELSGILGTQDPTISIYENNKSEPNHKNLVLICKRLNISSDYLLGIIDEPISWYDEDRMLLLPSGINESERAFLNEYVELVEHRRAKYNKSDK